jgi:hypothetical protein
MAVAEVLPTLPDDGTVAVEVEPALDIVAATRQGGEVKGTRIPSTTEKKTRTAEQCVRCGRKILMMFMAWIREIQVMVMA